MDRANAVRNVLVENGLPSAMLRTKGFGGDRPAAANDTPLGHFRNRRIEFRIAQVCDQYFPCEALDQAKRSSVKPSVPAEEPMPVLTAPLPTSPNAVPPARDSAIHTPDSPARVVVPPSVEPSVVPERVPEKPLNESGAPLVEKARPAQQASPASPNGGPGDGSSPESTAGESQKETEETVVRPKGRWIPPGETVSPKRRVLTEDPPIIRPKKNVPTPAPSAPKQEDEWYDPFDLF